MRRFLSTLSLLVVILCLPGCESPRIVENINQSQAIEIVALLNSYGISSSMSKERGANASYSVAVRRGYYHQSISLLKEHSLPSERELTFRDIVEQRGFLPNTRKIENLRFNHALAIELERLLENISEIVSAKVVVRGDTDDTEKSGGVSIVLQSITGAEIDSEEVLRLVSTIVPGLAKEQIVLDVSEVMPKSKNSNVQTKGVANDDGLVLQVPLVSFLTWRVPEGDITEITMVLGGVILVTLIVGCIFGYVISYYRYTRKQMSSPSTQSFIAMDGDDENRLPSVDN